MRISEGASSELSPELLERIEVFQKGEITEYEIYQKLAALIPDPHNRMVLEKMAREELGHYSFWKRFSGKDVGSDRLKLVFYNLVTRIFGLTFGIKLMEKRESKAVETYRDILVFIPETARILEDEEEHEHQILGMLDEKSLRYVGSVVLGINDALVEFTGSLAGFTLALQNTQLIAAAGLIMGIAASLSMGASEYLSQKSEMSENNPVTAAFYTGGAYVMTVVVLIMPFLLIDEPLQAFVSLAG